MKMSLKVLGVFVLAAFAVGQVCAQDASSLPPAPAGANSDQQQAGPAPSVARLSFIRGDVSMRRGDSGDWVALTLNTPLMAGDTVSTADGARAELQLDYANILRLSGHTEATIAGMADNHIQIQVAQGLVEYSVLKGADGDSEIDTPNVSVHPLRDGVYRLEVNAAGETIVIVRNGQADVSTPEGNTNVGAGEMITVRGTGADVQFKKSDARPADEWDQWSENRDRVIQNAEGTRNTNPYYTGASDLDSNGNWINVPDYGSVWSPNEPSDWAPYQEGDWVWEPYYDWTWVSSEPWGWAPYHYGRWFRWGERWCWWPGPVSPWYRPLWAPAYVSFFGFGRGFGFGFGFGSIGWFPIGPCDPFFPWFGFGIRFGFGDFFGFHDRFDFRRFPGAIGPLRGRFDERFSNARLMEHDGRFATSMRADQFGHGAAGMRAGISSSEVRSAKMMNGSVPAAPTRASLSATNRAANPSTMRNGGATHFFGRTQRSTSFNGSFNEQASRMQEALRANGHGNTGVQGSVTTRGNNMTQSHAGRSADRSGSSQPAQSGAGNGNWQRFNSQSQGQQAPVRSFEGQGQRPQQPAQSGAGNNGWQRFTPQPNEPSRGSIQGNRPTQPRYQGNSTYGNSRPPLNMRRPIINDRGAYGGSNRYSPPPSSSPYGGSAPRYSPPPSRPSYGGGSAPRSSPPSRPSGGGGGNHGGGGGGGSHGGGSSHHH